MGRGERPEPRTTMPYRLAAASCKPRLARDVRGVVMAEFLIALFPVMLAFLGFTQFAFAGIAKLMVRHAAALVTRAAVVVIDEASGIPGVPDGIYDGFVAGGIEVSRPEQTQGSGGSNVGNQQDDVSRLSLTATSNQGGSQQEEQGRTMDILGSLDRSSSRIKQIRTAAYIPLLAVSPNLIDDGIELGANITSGQVFSKMRVRKAIGGSGVERAVGALLYNMGAVAVTFPKEPGSKEPSSGMFQPGELITARVTYLFRCQVPLASLLLCSSGWSLLFGDAWFDPIAIRSIVRTVGSPPKNVEDLPEWTDEWKRQKAVHDRQQQRVEAFKGHEQDFKEVEWPFMLDVLLALPGARYMVLTAEAQLPVQGARYYPRVDKNEMEEMWKRQEEERKNQTQMPDVREALRPVRELVSNAAQEVDEQVEAIRGTVDDIKQQASEGIAQATSAYNQAKDRANEVVDGARNAYNEAKQRVDSQISRATKTFNDAKAAAEKGLGDVRKKANGLVKDAQGELDKANAALKQAKKEGGAALQQAQDRVNAAQAQLTQTQRDAQSMIDNATTEANDKIAAAEGEFNRIKTQGEELLGQAQDTLSRAQTEAQSALGEATDAYNDVVGQGKGLVNDTTGQAANALNQVRGAASNALGQVGDATSSAANSAAKGVTDTASDLGKQLDKIKPGGNSPGGASPLDALKPGALNLDQF